MNADAPYTAAAALTFALILASARQLPRQMASMQAGRWQLAPGQTLAGRTLALTGYGRIARKVADHARAFGMRVIRWASDAGRARATDASETVAESRDVFFAEADFVSLHVRQNPATSGVLTAQDLGAMKTTASFINTSRSGLVAAGALHQTMKVGRPGRLALDVFDQEPHRDPTDPLLTHPDVIVTPHIGDVTEDELNLKLGDIYDQTDAFAKGVPIPMINPEAWTVSAPC